MAWWRERLEELVDGATSPAELRLQAVASDLLPLGISGSELSQLEDAWLPLLEPFPWAGVQAEALRLRGRLLFGIGVRLLGAEPAAAEAAGAFWSLVDGAQHCSDAASRETLRHEAEAALKEVPPRVPSALRPLTVLAALAAADLIRDGSGLARLAAAVRHRLMGSLPRS